MAEIVQSTGANNATPKVPKHHSRFPLKEVFFDTHRFGEYHPHFVLNAWESDKHPVRCVSDTRSYTLKAPLMQDIVMNKDYFMVTMRSILPFQSERVRMNPNIGDDIPTDAYTSVSDFVQNVVNFASSFDTSIAAHTPSGDSNSPLHTTYCLQKAVFLESIFSRGSLLASLGSNLSSCLTVRNVNGAVITDRSIDKSIDECCRLIAADIAANGPWGVSIDGTAYKVYLPSMIDRTDAVTRESNPITLRDFMQKIRDTSDWLIVSNNSFSYALNGVIGASVQLVYTNGEAPMDLARLWAYQLSCAEYFSNDKVDYIYSADLFRQYIYNLCTGVLSSGGYTPSNFQFSWNGSFLPYDYLSSHFFNFLVARNFSNLSSSAATACLQYFLTLFGYKRSLRFKDYFTGARTRPLALVGNSASGVSTDVPVVGGNVSVIDVTRSIQAQRFLNAVNASGRKFSEWIQSFFGVTPNKDMHEPIFLAHSSDNIFAADNENTGDAVFQDTGGNNTTQNNVTAVFLGRSNNYEYSVDVKEPCIIIGVTSYDIERLYPDTIHRDFFIRDRYDMFNPMMQFIGDQPIYLHELEAGAAGSGSWDRPFGYTFRDMQWKSSFPRCAGAFGNGLLPGYAFLYQFDGRGQVISPDFIRSKNSELDEFYLALTGYSLGTYFHFIMRQVNVDDAVRPMVAKPQIL